MSEPLSPPPAIAPAKPSLSERFKALMEAYGGVAITLYLVIFALTIAGAAVAIRFFGWQPESAAGTTGLLVASWASAKVLQPLRILLTLVLTPVVARLLGRSPAVASQKPEAPRPPDASGD